MANTSNVDKLTARELEIAKLMASGMTAPQIGTALKISAGTVKKHLQSVYHTLEITGKNPSKQLMVNPKLLKGK